jgi:acid phosphatase family membrane protein YuiD
MGKTLALVVVIVGSVVLGLLYLPNPVGVARWPGITLLLSGVICLLVGQVLQSRVPGWLESAMAQETGELSSSAAALATDLATTAGSQLATGFTTPAVTLIVVGGLLFASSFLLRFRGGLDRGGR